MRRYDPGDAADLRHTVRDLDGELVAAAVEFEITKPSGGIVPIAPTSDATGVYDVTVPADDLDELGRYRYRWIVGGNVDDSATGSLYVAGGDDVDELPPLVSFERLVAKIGYEPLETERDRAEELLDQASELVRDAAGKTWADEGTGFVSGVPRRVRSIVVDVAYRAFTNPEGLSQRSIGDSSKSWDRAGREGGQIVYLTDDERRACRAAGGTSSLRVVTLVSPYSGDPGGDAWAEVTVQ